MKSYKILKAFAGLKEGEILKEDDEGEVNYDGPNFGENWMKPHDISFALALGFIEETGKIAQEVGGEDAFLDPQEFKSPINFPFPPQPPQNEWRPKVAEKVWFFDGIRPVSVHYGESDEELLPFVFKTESAALRAAEEIRNLLKTLPKE